MAINLPVVAFNQPATAPMVPVAMPKPMPTLEERVAMLESVMESLTAKK